VTEFSQGLLQAIALVRQCDPDVLAITRLSLQISATSVVLASVFAVPLGAWLAVSRFRGRGLVLSVVNGLMGLPAVVVGLVVYLLLSRSGPLGSLGWLFTPTGMVCAQFLLIFPLLCALSQQVVADAWEEYREQLRSLRASTWQSVRALLSDLRLSLLTVVLAGFGRAIAEVGAVMIVGGNIDGVTRLMTTAIALETSKGDLPLALALGFILVALVIIVNGAAHAFKTLAARHDG
jgi:tungstate transport system permease protein